MLEFDVNDDTDTAGLTWANRFLGQHTLCGFILPAFADPEEYPPRPALGPMDVPEVDEAELPHD